MACVLQILIFWSTEIYIPGLEPNELKLNVEVEYKADQHLTSLVYEMSMTSGLIYILMKYWEI